MFQNIPQEMRSYRQWVCWRSEVINEKPTKVPYCPQTGLRASVSDLSTWCSFEQAVEASKWYSGIGFVFTEHDPFFGIDLDDPQGDEKMQAVQYRIYEQFDTYAELSPSGRGLHLIGKAHITSGKHPHGIGIFSTLRFFTMTGNVYRNVPIKECQALAETLWQQMGASNAAIQFAGTAQTLSDDQIYDTAAKAVNGDKFETLWRGDWQNFDYPSQSEADFALIDIVAYYTQNIEQIARMFRSSEMGKRPKAKRSDYVASMIKRSFDRSVPPVDIEQVRPLDPPLALPTGSPGEAAHAFSRVEVPLPHPASIDAAAPVYAAEGFTQVIAEMNEQQNQGVGLLGEIAEFYFRSAPHPVAEIALAGAIGTLSGIVGKSFNVSNSGLSQYILLVAGTGTGKESMASGRSKLFAACQNSVPSINAFIGPGYFASGQALLKSLDSNPCYCSIIGEFGMALHAMCGERASEPQRMLRRLLLEFYGKSGQHSVIDRSVYSDKDKNVKTIIAPALTILGETTPESLYENFDERLILDGLLPRFLTIEYNGPRVDYNKNHVNEKPSQSLVNRISELTEYCLKLQQKGEVIKVKFNSEAEKLMNDFSHYATSRVNSTGMSVLFKELWTRAYVKVAKLAALVAVGVNPYGPVIDVAITTWAKEIVSRDIVALGKRFEKGDVGVQNNDHRYIREVARVILEYCSSPYEAIKAYDTLAQGERLHAHKIIPYSFIQRRCISIAVFRNARIGGTNAIKNAIDTLVETHIINRVSDKSADMYKTSAKIYAVINPHALMVT